jgi:hypothetical protein
MQDYEILLLSWTQLTALKLMGETDETGALRVLEDKLSNEYKITDISLVGRTYNEYTVGFSKDGENQLVRFDAEEVESIYDL